MRPTRNLQNLQRSALVRTDRLHAYISPLLTEYYAARLRSVDSAVAFVVIELDNLWAGTARSFFLSAAFCAADGKGNRIHLSRAPRARTTDEALTHAIRRCKPSRYKSGQKGPWTWSDEPGWWNPTTLLKAMDEIGASNYPQVSAAMSTSPGAFGYLHTFRNFYAHRSEGTRADIIGGLRRLRFPTTYTATSALTAPRILPGLIRPQALILDWLDDVRNTISMLV